MLELAYRQEQSKDCVAYCRWKVWGEPKHLVQNDDFILCKPSRSHYMAFCFIRIAGVIHDCQATLPLTDSAIATVHGPHIAVYDPNAHPRHRLLLFLVGTRSKAASSLPIDTAFARWGYHAISLDYEDNVIVVSCAHSLDPSAFGRYRQAIVTGAPVSTRIHVDAANSILNRFQKLLVYLVEHDPKGGWSQFLSDGQPVWSRVIVAGHSQGAGHAAYIGKLFKVDRVLMFSGPQDYMDNLHKPAPWQGRTSATPPSRFFAFLNRKDPFNVHH